MIKFHRVFEKQFSDLIIIHIISYIYLYKRNPYNKVNIILVRKVNIILIEKGQ
jgi:hypothetical protein